MSSSLGSLVDDAVSSVTTSTRCAFGPIPLEVAADSGPDLDEIASHLAPCSEPTWNPLSVVTVTTDTIPRDLVPPSVRPEPGRTAIAHVDGITAYTAGHESTTWFFDEARSRAVRWVDRVDDIPLWEQINPLRAAGRWWAVRHRAAMVHCAAVADRRGAVVLVGDAGAGKSTTSLACLDSGLDVLGDDFCFVETPLSGAAPLVHPTYRLGKLDDSSLGLLPRLAGRVVGTGMRGKSLVDIGAEPLASRPIRAFCHVVQRPGGSTSTDPITRAEVIAASASSTVMQARLVERETLSGLIAAVRRVPAYRMWVDDVVTVPDEIDRLLDAVNSSG